MITQTKTKHDREWRVTGSVWGTNILLWVVTEACSEEVMLRKIPKEEREYAISISGKIFQAEKYEVQKALRTDQLAVFKGQKDNQ